MICLIFHTAIRINGKNWRITIKLHFENSSIFLKKQTYTHARAPLPLFVFVHISIPPPPPPQRTYFLNDPLLREEEHKDQWKKYYTENMNTSYKYCVCQDNVSFDSSYMAPRWRPNKFQIQIPRQSRTFLSFFQDRKNKTKLKGISETNDFLTVISRIFRDSVLELLPSSTHKI